MSALQEREAALVQQDAEISSPKNAPFARPGNPLLGFLRGLGRFALNLFQEFLGIVVGIVKRGYFWSEGWLLDSRKSLYGLAMTRIVLGATGFGLLFFNFSTRLYSFGPGSAWNGEAASAKSDFPKLWIFSAFHDAILNDAVYTFLYLVLMALSVLFMIGWRFKLVLPCYFVLWVSFIEANDMLGDQGDNMYRIVLLFLFFADPAARISLDARRRKKWAAKLQGSPWLVRKWRGQRIFDEQLGNLFHNLTLIILTAQVCFVYVSGALYKAGGTPWSTGYAIYNPLMTDRFGTWPELSQLLTYWAPLVALISWGSIIIQMSFPLMLLTRPTRVLALIGVMSFHLGIALLMGLPWFSLTMIAVDFIFIRDRTWKNLGIRLRGSYQRAMSSRELHPDD
ncbi:HTTM domain-containing protein [Psychromicrobium sp. YIM B11713]|uniref:HTTM domain-containing protein n=1 Tax=Psychromicrobium sp. YIM B11713 TaxID=3145233 RepID=UPI00374E6186